MELGRNYNGYVFNCVSWFEHTFFIQISKHMYHVQSRSGRPFRVVLCVACVGSAIW